MTIFPEPEGRASKAVLNQQEDAVLTLVRGLVGIRTLLFKGSKPFQNDSAHYR